MIFISCFFFLLSSLTFANPFPDPAQVRSPSIVKLNLKPQLITNKRMTSQSVLRVEVQWKENETYEMSGLFLESSGTESLIARSKNKDSLGSYKAQLKLQDGTIVHASVGTGRMFRKLVKTLSFRFPISQNFTSGEISLEAEHPESGVMETVLQRKVTSGDFKVVPSQDVKIFTLKSADKQPAIKVNFYAEGFLAKDEKKFLQSAEKAVAVLTKDLPGSEYFEYSAVFAPSKLKIGRAQDLGESPLKRDSFLGLYFPHWAKFNRWYHVVYPTDQTHYRNALAQAPYDYPIALIDDAEYWGVGNYKELTAVPVGHSLFAFLLLHEFGHFMGLNEEYESGGPTELEFAKNISEPWSQNITFNPSPEKLKWIKQTEPGISLPTTMADFERFGGRVKNPVGAYKGGYAESEPRHKSHKPVLKCTMGQEAKFCPVCSEALRSLIDFDRSGI